MNPQILLLILIIVIVILFITYNNAIKGGAHPPPDVVNDDPGTFIKKYAINTYDRLIETDTEFYIVNLPSGQLPYVFYDPSNDINIYGFDLSNWNLYSIYKKLEKNKEITCTQYENGILIAALNLANNKKIFFETNEFALIFGNIFIIGGSYYHCSIINGELKIHKLLIHGSKVNTYTAFYYDWTIVNLGQYNYTFCELKDMFKSFGDDVLQILDYPIEYSFINLSINGYVCSPNSQFVYIELDNKFFKCMLFSKTFIEKCVLHQDTDYDKYFNPKGYVRQFEGINTRLVKINGDDKIYFVYRLQNPSNPNEPFYMYTYDKKTFDVKSLTMSDL